MVVAFLITGAVGYGADDIAAQGQKSYTDISETLKL